MIKYPHLFIDADDTLFDFPAAQRGAICSLADTLGCTVDEHAISLFDRINDDCWVMFEKGEITQAILPELRFTRWLDELSLTGVSAAECSKAYIEALSRQSILLEHSVEVMRELHQICEVSIITNGIDYVQHNRISRSEISGYIHNIFTSGAMGYTKPDPRVIYHVISTLGIKDKSGIVFAGDSLRSDMPCAHMAGIDKCLFAKKAFSMPDYDLEYVISDIRQLVSIVKEGNV